MTDRQPVLTPVGRQLIERELHELRGARRAEVADQIRQAKAHGDVTESAEYDLAKSEQALVEARIAELTQALAAAVIVDTSEVSTSEVGIGSLVTLRDVESGEEWELSVVGSLEADPARNRISNECPLGAALLGREVGETIELRVPEGESRYEILSLRRPDG